MPRVQDCILGSGAASGILALALARAGRSVMVVEEGPGAVAPDFSWSETDVANQLLRRGGRIGSADGSLSVLQGRCLGGSATVGGGIVAPFGDGVLDAWVADHGWGDVPVVSLAGAAGRVLERLGAAPDPEGGRAAGDVTLAKGAQGTGAEGRWLARAKAAAPSGPGALGGPATAMLEEARARFGAEIRTGARAEALTVDGATATQVRGLAEEVEAERFIVCAGALQATALLRRSGLGVGPLGEGLTLNHRLLVAGRFGAATSRDPAPGAYVLDGALTPADSAAPGFAVTAADVGPATFAAHSRAPLPAVRALLAEWAHVVPLWCVAPEGGASISFDRYGQPKLRRGDRAPTFSALRDAVVVAARALLAAGAVEVHAAIDGVGPITTDADVAAIAERELTATDLPMLCLDPVGGCALGRDGVVDRTFRVRGTDNVYVADASIFPTGLGLHPLVPVMAVGDLLAAQLLAS